MSDADNSTVSSERADRLCADMVARWLRGERVPVEAICQRFPNLGEDEKFELVLTEVVLRHEHGVPAPLPEYLWRFPQFHERLERHFALQTTLAAAGDDPAQTRPQRSQHLHAAPRQRSLLPDVPGFEVQGELGSGAMGIVYRARQLSLNRPVALKMILAGRLGDTDQARFDNEAAALARLQHPHIVQIHDVGVHGDRAYLVCELVEGGTLADRLKLGALPARAAAELVETLAHAMEYAHQQGIVHRDLKPANILLQIADCRLQIVEGMQVHTDRASPQSAICNLQSAIPKIADFGLAKLMDRALPTTLSGEVVGTPAYMAPEQARSQRQAVGFGADVYALGAILYEALTGRPPFCGETALATLLLVSEEQPVPPGRLQAGLPHDLEVICLKCLEKEPHRRYASARELAEDLARWRKGETIRARPATRWERTWRWGRRHPLAASLAILSGVSVLLAVVTLAVSNTALTEKEAAASRALKNEQKALSDLTAARDREQQQQYRDHVRKANRLWQANQVSPAELLLDLCPLHLRHWEWRYLNTLRQARPQTLIGHTNTVTCVVYDADGRRLASCDFGGTIKLWDADDGKELKTFESTAAGASDLAFSPQGEFLALATSDNVSVWNLLEGKIAYRSPGGGFVAFSSDGAVLATAEGNNIVFLDPPTGQVRRRLVGHPNAVRCGQFSKDAKQFASGGDDGALRTWNVTDGMPTPTVVFDRQHITSIRFTPDGAHAVVGLLDRLYVVDVKTGRHRLELPMAPSAGVAVSPDGKWLARSLPNAAVKVRRLDGGPEELLLRGHLFAARSVAFHPNGSRLASGGSDNNIYIWSLPGVPDVATVPIPSLAVSGLAYSPDGKTAALAAARYAPQDSSVESIYLLNLATGKEQRRLKGANRAAFDSAGRLLAVGSMEGSVGLYDTSTWKIIRVLRGHAGPCGAVGFSADGTRLVTGGEDSTIRFWDVVFGKQLSSFAQGPDWVNGMALTADGSILAAIDMDGKIGIWDVAGMAQLRTLQPSQRVRSLSLSADGSMLAAAGMDRVIHIWDTQTGTLIRSVYGNTEIVWCLGFSPDGRRLVSGSADHSVRVWDVASGQQLISLPGPQDRIGRVAFSPDGRYLVGTDKAIRIWDAGPPPGDEVAPSR